MHYCHVVSHANPLRFSVSLILSKTSIQIENDRLGKGVHQQKKHLYFGCLLICFGISDNLTIEHSNSNYLMLF